MPKKKKAEKKKDALAEFSLAPSDKLEVENLALKQKILESRMKDIQQQHSNLGNSLRGKLQEVCMKNGLSADNRFDFETMTIRPPEGEEFLKLV